MDRVKTDTFLICAWGFALMVIIGWLLLPQSVFAASIIPELEKSRVRIGDTVNGSVIINPDGASVNTLAGQLSYDRSLFTLTDIRFDQSVSKLWIDKPAATSPNPTFSAAIPGGFSGLYTDDTVGPQPGVLFSFTLQAKKPGDSIVSIEQVESYTKAGETLPTTGQSRPIRVESAQKPQTPDVPASEASDQQINSAPKPFTPQFIRPKDECDAPLLAAFQTSDDSGVAYYQIAVTDVRPEGEGISWSTTTSPYELTNPQVGQWVNVRAVDRQGSSTIGSTQISTEDMTNAECPESQTAIERGDNKTVYVLIALITILLILLWVKRRSQ